MTGAKHVVIFIYTTLRMGLCFYMCFNCEALHFSLRGVFRARDVELTKGDVVTVHFIDDEHLQGNVIRRGEKMSF